MASVPGRGYRFVAPIDFSEPERLPVQLRREPPSHNLPLSKSRVVGRANAIDTLRDHMSRQRLVTIAGAGGIGKTTVALAVAEALLPIYPDGIRFVDLAPVENPQFIAGALGTALGVAIDPTNAVPRLVEVLRDKRMLIVLDSCEHVVEAAASLAEHLLAGAFGVRILATSREPLRAEGERVHRLPPLEIPADRVALTASDALAYPAVQLFVERAAAILDGYELSDADAPVVSDICRRLGGVALAIELAAARTDAFGIQQLAALLDDRFRILKRGKRTAQLRHQSLTATLDWSYEFLPESERVVLRRLSVFAGAFTLESAIAVAGDERTDVLEDLACLVAKSLVSADVGGAVVNYRLLDTTRAYAIQKLTESGDFENYARRHALHHLDWARRAERAWDTQTVTEWLEEHGRMVDDVRAALDWAFSSSGDMSVGIALTVETIHIWLQLALYHECRDRLERAIASLSAQPTPNEREELRLRIALDVVFPHSVRPLPASGEHCMKTLALGEKLGDLDAQGISLFNLSSYCIYRGKFRDALAAAERCCAVSAESNNAVIHVMGHTVVAIALHYMGVHARALAHVEPTVKQISATSNQPVALAHQVNARWIFSEILWVRGFPDQAASNARIVVDESQLDRTSLTLAAALATTACPIAIEVGDFVQAKNLVEMLLDRPAKSGLNAWNAVGRCLRGRLLLAQGDLAGLSDLRAALDWLREARFAVGHTISLGTLAEGLAVAGRFAEARAAIDEALERVETNEEYWCLPELLRIKGEITRSGGSANGAGAAEDCFRQALDCARTQESLSWELRAATSMAKLWRDQGKSAAAHELLSGIYDRFTEGFETADLRAARTLIGELQVSLAAS